MKYENKVLVLKETADGFSAGSPVGAIIRVETENGISSVFLSVINVKTVKNGTYALFLTDGKEFFYIKDVGKKPTSVRDRIERTIPCKKISAGLIYTSDELPTTVAFSSGDETLTLTGFKKLVADYFYRDFKDKKKTGYQKEYDDEAVATENYYDYDEEMSEKIRAIADANNERFVNENGERDSKEQEIATEKATGTYRNGDETGATFGENQRYYQKVRLELDKTFSSFPHERVLENIFRGSRFAKINYTDSRYYVVGVISESGREKYICYGVPDKFSEYAPKELEGYCSFIPLSVFDLSGNGYWMMFQDADTGECLKR